MYNPDEYYEEIKRLDRGELQQECMDLRQEVERLRHIISVSGRWPDHPITREKLVDSGWLDVAQYVADHSNVEYHGEVYEKALDPNAIMPDYRVPRLSVAFDRFHDGYKAPGCDFVVVLYLHGTAKYLPHVQTMNDLGALHRLLSGANVPTNALSEVDELWVVKGRELEHDGITWISAVYSNFGAAMQAANHAKQWADGHRREYRDLQDEFHDHLGNDENNFNAYFSSEQIDALHEIAEMDNPFDPNWPYLVTRVYYDVIPYTLRDAMYNAVVGEEE